ncbi:MAG: type II secretion system protein [Bacilli bacterium]|nr:type II secretion system protein [Bacilli bacterium]
MNHKGFTLVELLATIVIMSILLLIAVPAVSNTIEQSRKDTFATNGKSYITTARNGIINGTYIAKKPTTLAGEKCTLPPTGKYTAIDISALKGDKKINKSPYNASLEEETSGKYRGYVIVINITNDNKGTGTQDKYIYFFAAIDSNGNGIDQFIDESSLSKTYVKKGTANTNINTNYKKNLLTSNAITINDGKYKNTSATYHLYMYCRNQ